jgi:hypothetical protein
MQSLHGLPTCTVARRWRSALAAATLLAGAAQAHDTWFEALPTPRAGEVSLRLGTGNRFPKHEYTVASALLDRQGCRHGDAPAILMRAGAAGADALPLRAKPAPQGARRGQSAAITCWSQLRPLDVTIDDAKVPLYLDEIAASPALREAWRAMRERGVRWQERYTKHARIELRDARLGGGAAAAARPLPMGMDIVLDGPLERLQVGDTVRFTVLRDGQPLAGQAIELRSHLSPLGLWLRSDAQGRAQVRVPLAGRWLLRGTDLRPSTTDVDRWESRFVTLAFDVAAR